MKPLVYLDIAHNATGAIVIDEKRFKEILNEVYEAGYQDGFEKGKNSNYLTPYWNGNRNWNPNPISVTYNQETNKKIASPLTNGISIMNGSASNMETSTKETLIKSGTIRAVVDSTVSN